MNRSQEIIERTAKLGANNYAPKPVVFASAEGALVTNPEGEQFYDMLSAYSALNFGHRHPEIIAAAKEQLDRVTLTSRAFQNDRLYEFYEALCKLTGKNMALPMNTGVEAVESAIKTARRWACDVKGVPDGSQQIIVCENNFHGRTTTVISFSTDPVAKRGFGPYTPGFKIIPYGDLAALEAAITPFTAAFLVEPIQGEAGIIMPPEGFLRKARDLCKKNNVLFISDEVQTGFARTGKMFASDWEDISPDIYVMGKALGGGVMPVSAIAADREILGVFDPGSHGSTFGGNPLACAVAVKAMEILTRDDYPAMAERKGQRFMQALREIENPEICDIRGRGLLIGVEFTVPAAGYIKKLIANGVLAKETHEHTIRFAPPVNIEDDQLDDAIVRIKKTLTK